MSPSEGGPVLSQSHHTPVSSRKDFPFHLNRSTRLSTFKSRHDTHLSRCTRNARLRDSIFQVRMHASPYVLHDHQISFQVWPSANTRLGGCCSHLDPGLDGALIGLHTTVVMFSSFAPAATHYLAPSYLITSGTLV